MPELPEVEALARVLHTRLVGHTVARLDVVAVSALKTVDPPPSAVVGRAVCRVTRLGKFLDVHAPPVHFVVHLARSGWLRWRASLPDGPVRPGRGPLAVRFGVEDGSGFDVTEAATQKRLAVYLVRDPRDVPGVARLGADPLAPDFNPALLTGILAAAGRSQLKGVLTDQAALAGVGNAYSDEVLWAARLSPFAPASGLAPDAVGELHAALVGTLRDALARAEGLADVELKEAKRAAFAVHGRTGAPCPRCGRAICQVSFAESSLQYCPACQTGGRLLADRRLSRLLK
ncbi:MAG: DNA-formamidopyrimidine glycosylase family protein [Mycobacteriales bacterium]